MAVFVNGLCFYTLPRTLPSTASAALAARVRARAYAEATLPRRQRRPHLYRWRSTKRTQARLHLLLLNLSSKGIATEPRSNSPGSYTFRVLEKTPSKAAW